MSRWLALAKRPDENGKPPPDILTKPDKRVPEAQNPGLCQVLSGCRVEKSDENLMRSELTPTQEAEHLAKRKELWEARQSGQIVPIESKRDDGRGHRPTAFASETAEATGVDKRTINRAVSRAEGVVEEVRDQLRGTDLAHAERGQQVAEDVTADPDQPPAARYSRYSRYSCYFPPPNSGNSSQHVARLEAATPEPDRQDDARPDADGYCRTWTGRIVRLDEWRNLTAWDRHGPAGRLFCGICKQWVSRDADCPQSECWKGDR
ncbi:hypothetical protein [Paracoccus siganidrum]|uniref:hypothetical protein n=1 Tax=Paracoccus siganidrum TaxID=1276757 RepID=UPI0011C34805|nr:hypothetical protein [Paracoccus siganidrum]